ncbi:MAG: PQQ-binding-like beta-propeller repeat protein [Pseudobdellovibrio sp.]
MQQLKKISLIIVVSLFFSSCSIFSRNEKINDGVTLNVRWVRDTVAKKNEGFRKINRMSPVIYKNKVIVGNALDGLVSYDQISGQELWRIAIPYGVEASGTVIKDRLFIGSNNGKIYSIDLSLGSIVWVFDTKSEAVAEPLLNEGILFFISGNQSVFALDAVSGKQLWTYSRQDASNLMTIRGGSKPAFSNGILYVGFSDGSLVSFSAKTGTQQWEITLNKNTRFKDIDSSPVIDGDSIYISSYDDKLYCLSKNKGEIIWSLAGGGASTPIIVGDRIIFGSSKSEMISANKKDGKEVWKFKSNNGILSDPVLYKDFIISGESQGSLVLLDLLTGVKKASFEPGRGVFSRPTVQSDKNLIYFISGEGNAYSIGIDPVLSTSIYYLKN